MTLIIDANRAGDFSKPLNGHASFILREIAENRIRIVVGGRLFKELAETKLASLLVEWSRAGRIMRVDSGSVDKEETVVRRLSLQSDDPHIVALARVSGSRLLYSEDNNLVADFKNISFISPKGKVFKTTTKSKIVASLCRKYGG